MEEGQRHGFEREDELSDGDLEDAYDDIDMINDELKLGYFSPMDGWTIHITDLDPHSLAANGGLEDVSLVKKYEISDEDYNKRDDNFRKWRQMKQAADPSWTMAKEIKQNQDRRNAALDPNTTAYQTLVMRDFLRWRYDERRKQA